MRMFCQTNAISTASELVVGGTEPVELRRGLRVPLLSKAAALCLKKKKRPGIPVHTGAPLHVNLLYAADGSAGMLVSRILPHVPGGEGKS